MPGTIASSLALLWVLVNALIFVVYRRDLRRIWREPVFRQPILIIESDDWGAGPLSQADALDDIARVLQRHQDATGHAPVFNLALVLAVPDGPGMRTAGAYRRVSLDDPMFSPVLAALRRGQSSGVFALQLHGMEHYWPQTLMNSQDVQVQGWLRQSAPAVTEQLPPHLQSRWVDAGRLPSTAHSEQAVRAAVAEEVLAYARIIGEAPRVVVPPTFVWTRVTEQAWAKQGLECIVTPGWRYTRRNTDGLPDGDEGPIVNGDQADGVTYLARSDYFEPVRGRDAAHALRALDRATSEGRPCLLENHRDNFIGDAQTRARSLCELDKLYRDALARHSDLRFMPSWQLACILRTRDARWLIDGTWERVPYAWTRLQRAGRLWKLMTLSGLTPVCALLMRLFGAPLPAAQPTFR
jgi:hypothetical protein